MSNKKINPSDFHVLVVDDEESIRTLLTDILTEAKYNVKVASSAEEALETIKGDTPHMILTDIRMPGMSGLDLTSEVKKLCPEIEIIIMTSHASIDTAIESLRLGAYDYINKPFEDIAEVLALLNRTTEKIYLKFQNEFLMKEITAKNTQLTDANKAIKKTYTEISKHNQLMQHLSHAKTPDQTLKVLCNALSDLFTDKPTVYLEYHVSSYSIRPRHITNMEQEKATQLVLDFTNSNVKNIPQLLPSIGNFDPFKDLVNKVFSCTSFLVFPFTHREQIIGIFVILAPTEKEVSFIDLGKRFISTAGVTFDNAVLQAEIEEMAIKDPLTGLYNRRVFEERLKDEIARSSRTKLPLSLIYMDVDYFKNFNDTNGHPLGDVLLKGLSNILIKSSRSNDIPARIGGEEFILLLPATPLAGALQKAEMIRSVVERSKFPNMETQPLKRITISVGVSEFPSTAPDAKVLISSADEAMYKVKQSGKNRVEPFTPGADYTPPFAPVAPEAGPRKTS